MIANLSFSIGDYMCKTQYAARQLIPFINSQKKVRPSDLASFHQAFVGKKEQLTSFFLMSVFIGDLFGHPRHSPPSIPIHQYHGFLNQPNLPASSKHGKCHPLLFCNP
jgi:hypothetical protein